MRTKFLLGLLLIFSLISLVSAGTCVQYPTYKLCDEGKSLIVHEYKYQDNEGNWRSYETSLVFERQGRNINITLPGKFGIILESVPLLNNKSYAWSQVFSNYPNLKFDLPIYEMKKGSIKFDLNLTNGGDIGENLPEGVGIKLDLKDSFGIHYSDIERLDDGLLFFGKFKLWIPEGCAEINKTTIVFHTLSERCLDPILNVTGGTTTLGGNQEYDTIIVEPNGVLQVDDTYGWLNLTATESIIVYGEIDGAGQSNFTGGSGGGAVDGVCADGNSGASGKGDSGGSGGIGGNGGSKFDGCSCAGGNGGAGGNGASQVGTETTIEDYSQGYGAGGGGAGSSDNGFYGSAGSGGTGGNGGAGIRVYSPTIFVKGTIIAKGGDGGDGGQGDDGGGSADSRTYGGGGGGGGSAGTILLIGQEINISGATFNVAPGNGGIGGEGDSTGCGGADGSSGSSGSAGRIKFFYSLSFENESTSLNLGSGGTSYYEQNDMLGFGNYTSNVKIYVDGALSWEGNGTFTGSENVNVVEKINLALETCTPDESGYCTIPIDFYSSSSGVINVTSVETSFNISSYFWNIVDLAELSTYRLRIVARNGIVNSRIVETVADFIISSAPNDFYKFFIKNSIGSNVAWFGSEGNLVLKGICTFGSSCNAPSNSFIFKDSLGNEVAHIDSEGNLCIETGDCSDHSETCNPTTDAFIMRNLSSTNVSYIDFTGDLCLTGGLYENSIP